MSYPVPSLEQMLLILIAFFRSLLPDRNVGRFSFYWKLLKSFAGAVTDVHAHVVSAGNDSVPTRARGSAQDEWLKIVGSERKGATPARKANAGRLTGTPTTPFSLGAQLRHRASGQLFQVNESGTIPVAGFIDVDILAISVGSSTRLQKGQVLEFMTPIGGISTSVELQLDLDEDGTDSELDGAALVRLLGITSQPSAGGNQADFVRWALSVTGISSAFAYHNRGGGGAIAVGSVDVAALHTGTGSARFLNSGERAELLEVLAGFAPGQVGGTGGPLRVLNTVAETANVEIRYTVTGEPQYAFDWDDSVVPTVLVWTAATLTIQLSAARPATMKAGDRVCLFGVPDPNSQDAAPIVIESLISTDSFRLQTAPKKPDGTAATPVATDKVFAGGPLTAKLRDAVLAHINSDRLFAAQGFALPAAVAASQGISTARLSVLLEGLGTANPANRYGTWTGALLRSNLLTIAQYTKGVARATVITPSVDLEATDFSFPNDADIGMLSAGYVLIRKG